VGTGIGHPVLILARPSQFPREPVRTTLKRKPLSASPSRPAVTKGSGEQLGLLRAAFQAARDAIIITDGQLEAPGPRILFVNDAFCVMTGYSREEATGKTPRILQGPKTDRALLDRLKKNLMEQGHFFGETTNYGKDGSEFLLEWRISSVLNADGNVTHYVAIQRDITERRKLEQRVSALQRFEGLAGLASGIAHDFNNLLTVITGYNRLLARRTAQDFQSQEYAAEIGKAADRATALTKSLLAYGRKQVLRPQLADPNDLLRAFLPAIKKLAGPGIKVSLIPGTGIGLIHLDTAQLSKAILDLVKNAREAMPGGGKLTIELTNIELSDEYAARHVGVTPGSYVRIAVTDTGTGMDKETRERAFDPFFTTRKATGSAGLGLSTAYGIVKQSGGNIWIYSEPAKGTTFKIYLPHSQALPLRARTGRGNATFTLGPSTILVVEDEAPLRRMLVQILTERGHHALEAEDGVAALECAKSFGGPIHLLLTDVAMPRMDGPTLAREMSSLRPETKVLYISGFADQGIVHSGILAPGTAFLEKPFTPEAVERKVMETLSA